MAITNLSASEFGATTGSWEFQAGETETNAEVTVTTDGASEAEETFFFRLSQIVSASGTGEFQLLSIDLQHLRSPSCKKTVTFGVLSFICTSCVVNESSGEFSVPLSISVQRTGRAFGAVSAGWTLSNITTTGGVGDIDPMSDSVAFADGETNQTFRL